MIPDKTELHDHVIDAPHFAEGNFAFVFSATQKSHPHRQSAVKVCKQPGSNESISGITKEVDALTALRGHPNIIDVYSPLYSEVNLVYYMLEKADCNLGEYLASNPGLTAQERLRLFDQVCQGLKYAHDHGYAHRDMHHNNILAVTRNGAAVLKLADFGMARDLGSPPTSTPPFNVWGFAMTPPELPFKVIANPQDNHYKAGDVYALGIILYTIFSGLIPTPYFHAMMYTGIPTYLNQNGLADTTGRRIRDDIIMAKRERHYSLWLSQNRAQSLLDVSSANSDLALSRKVNGIVMGASQPDYSKRYQTVDEVISAVGAL